MITKDEQATKSQDAFILNSTSLFGFVIAVRNVHVKRTEHTAKCRSQVEDTRATFAASLARRENRIQQFRQSLSKKKLTPQCQKVVWENTQ